ncbi:MAG: zinc ribbon domain-containing protein [Terracidiphilus sp.]|jgi:hypothetical protein
MYCSACGQALDPGQGFCPKCGRPSTAPIPSVPGMEFQLENYSGKIRALGTVWIIYAALSLLLGIAGMTFAHAFFSHFGMWGNQHWGDGSVPPDWFGPAIMHFIWIALLLRACLAVAAGWGLLEHTQWGRIVAIVAAILSLIRFPFGTALGIWTLIVLLGYRNSTLYEQL